MIMKSRRVTVRLQFYTRAIPPLLLLMLAVRCSGGPEEKLPTDSQNPTRSHIEEPSSSTKLKTNEFLKKTHFSIPTQTYHLKLDRVNQDLQLTSVRAGASTMPEKMPLLRGNGIYETKQKGTIYLRHPRKQSLKHQSQNFAHSVTSGDLGTNIFLKALGAGHTRVEKSLEIGSDTEKPLQVLSSIKHSFREPPMIGSRSLRDAFDDSRTHVLQPQALPVETSQDDATSNSTELPSKNTTPSIESLLPSKIIPSLPPHLRDLTTTTPMPSIFFNNSFISNLTAQLGQSVFLPCRTRHSSDRKFIPQVSWVRRRDWHILTSGTVTYTKEQRYDVHHPEGSTEWTLVIKYVKQEDAGTYECQLTSGEGLISHLVHLSIVVPKAVIPGNGEYHVDTGSTISLTCYVDQSPIVPRYIFWYHNSRMINYDRERGGINVEIESRPRVLSRLTVTNARTADSGNYTCDAHNTESDSITVYITEGNKIAAIQPRAVDGASLTAPSAAVLLLALAFHCVFSRAFGSLQNIANMIVLDLLGSCLGPVSKRSCQVLLASEGFQEDSQCSSKPEGRSVFNGAFSITRNVVGKKIEEPVT